MISCICVEADIIVVCLGARQLRRSARPVRRREEHADVVLPHQAWRPHVSGHPDGPLTRLCSMLTAFMGLVRLPMMTANFEVIHVVRSLSVMHLSELWERTPGVDTTQPVVVLRNVRHKPC